MIKKIDNCIYCNTELENHNAKRRFCSDKCRVYYGREIKRGTMVNTNIISGVNPDIFKKQSSIPTNLTKTQKLQWLRENK